MRPKIRSLLQAVAALCWAIIDHRPKLPAEMRSAARDIVRQVVRLFATRDDGDKPSEN